MILEKIRKLKGQKVAVLCDRFQYRGILTEVHEDGLVLSNPTAIEISGPTQSDRPICEDPIETEICICKSSI